MSDTRISYWAKQFGIQITPFDAVAQPPAGATVYRVVDIFTTRDGKWDPSNTPGSIEQWARDAYLKPFGAPDYFDDAGADHHIFGRVLGNNNAIIHYYTHVNNDNHTEQRAKSHSGWANVVMYGSSSFVPERGELGPWAWKPAEPWADVVVGAGMPSKWHVSFFAVWRKETYQPTEKPVEPDAGGGVPLLPSPDYAALEKRVAKIEALLNSWTGD